MLCHSTDPLCPGGSEATPSAEGSRARTCQRSVTSDPRGLALWRWGTSRVVLSCFFRPRAWLSAALLDVCLHLSHVGESLRRLCFSGLPAVLPLGLELRLRD